jgi:hypothetical protein
MSGEPAQNAPAATVEPIVVPYADGVSRHVNVYSENGELVFVLPRKLSFWMVFGVAMTVAAPMTVGMLTLGLTKQWTAVALPVFQGLFMGVFFLIFSLRNWRKDFIIRLTPTHLTLGPMLTGGPQQEVSIDRKKIYRVAYVEHSGNLVVRATGEEMVELRPTPEPLALRFIARELSRQLGISDQSDEPELRASSAS